MSDSTRFMLVPLDPPRPQMATLAELFDKWKKQEDLTRSRELDVTASTKSARHSVRDTFFFGASAAMACLVRGSAPQIFDGLKFSETLAEITGYAEEQRSGKPWTPPPRSVRATSLAAEYARDREDRLDRDVFYLGAGAALKVLLDEDAYRINLRKIPFLVEEVHAWITITLARRGDSDDHAG